MENIENCTIKDIVSLAHKMSDETGKDVLSCYNIIFSNICSKFGIETYNISVPTYFEELLLKGC